MRHAERETFEVEGKATFPWYCSTEKAHTQIVTPNERGRIVRWLRKNGAMPIGAPQDESERPRNIEIWHISDNEPLFIHYRKDVKTGLPIIRLDSSTATAAELMEDGILSKPPTREEKIQGEKLVNR